jgi:hypothetical protein
MPFPAEKRTDAINAIIEGGNIIGHRSVTYKDKPNTRVDVYEIDLKFLIFNRYNGRINIDMDTDDADAPAVESEYDEALEQKICEYLYNSAISSNNKTQADIDEKGQLEYGIVTADGVIVDGNRRAMILKRLGKNIFRAGILKDAYTKESGKAIRELETQLQFDQDAIVDYGPLAKYLTVAKLHDEDGHSFDKISILMGRDYSKTEVEKMYRTFGTMTDYLDHIETPGIYTLLRIGDKQSTKEEGFLQTSHTKNSMDKGTLITEKPMEQHKRKYEEMMLDHIRVESVEVPQDYRLMGVGRDKSGLLHHEDLFLEMWEKHKIITEPITQLPELKEYKEKFPNLATKDLALKKEEEIKELAQDKLRDLFKEYTGKAKSRAQDDKPERRLERILAELKLVSKAQDSLANSDNIDNITLQVKEISRLIEGIKRSIGL